jgi:N-acetylglutamate synthase
MTPERLFALAEATWPAAQTLSLGPWTLRHGQGGGSRVSAATSEQVPSPADLAEAEQAMRAWGQSPLVMVRAGQTSLDALLARHGYRIKDPVVALAAPVAALARDIPPVTGFAVWPPLAVQAEIWAAGGIGPARLAVMDRVRLPKVSLLGRLDDRPAGTAFVASDGDGAMIHALEIGAPWRRRGLGRHLLALAARWAAAQGAQVLALLVARDNGGALAMYRGAGMSDVGGYHYRVKEDAP